MLKTSTSTSADGSLTSTWTMNAKGYLESLADENDNVTYAYDAEDHLITSKYEAGFIDITFAYEMNGMVENNLGGIDGMGLIFNNFGYPDFMVVC